ncbi:MAG: HlyD family efflux transporter periplasmic adaptor subunit [Cyanothece sp. SIO1E1]|nr:HlyD family efflux transporter periplasmic adaptor subunit [Cyanothece sp. SIO1E1]
MQTENNNSQTTIESGSEIESPAHIDAAASPNANQPELPGLGAIASPFKLPHAKKSPWPAAILLMLVILGFVGLRAFKELRSGPKGEETETVVSGARLPVRVIRTQRGAIQDWVSSPDGQVQAVRGKHLTFEANGEITTLKRIDQRYLREGDLVSKGELLATIDDREFRANIRSAQADLEVARQQEDQAVAGLQQAKANLEKAQSDLNLAKTELKRRQELFSQGAIPATEQDEYANRVDAAQAALKVAEQDVRTAEDGISSAAASTAAANAQLANANVALEDTQLIAPIDGVVAYLNIREGDYWATQRLQVTGDYQDIVESVPIIVVDPNELEVVMELTALEGAKIRPGQTVYIALDDEISQAFVEGLTNQTLLKLSRAQGRVFAVNPAVTPGGRAVQVRVKITEGLSRLRVGERVQTWIEADSKPNAIVLPFGAVIFRERQPYVFVVNETDGTVEQRPIKQGIEGLDAIEVLEGVQPGERVVTEGNNRLVSGASIEIIN